MKRFHPVSIVQWAVALFPAVFAALPLFGARFIPTHDGEFHAIRIWQFSKMLADGFWFPRWAPDLNNGYGVPLFSFHYPFPNYIGSIMHLSGLPITMSFQWTLGLGYLTAVAACYVFVANVFGRKAAVPVTVLFSYIPYWFTDMYVRGSVGEVWAMSFVMTALAAASGGRFAIFAFSVAGLILSHNIMAMIFVPLLLLVSVADRRLVFPWMMGVTMAVYFWLPALFERAWVVGLNIVSYLDHFPAVFQLLLPSWGNGYSVPGIDDGMSFQIGLVAVAAWCGAVIMVLLRVGDVRFRRMAAAGAVLSVVAVYMMTEYSGDIWRAVPVVQYLQFPWRLLSVTMIVTAVYAGYIARTYPKMGISLAVMAILASFGYIRPVTYAYRSDVQVLGNTEFTRGTSSLGNTFNTRWMHDPPVGSPGQFTVTEGSIVTESTRATRYTFTTVSETEGTVTVPVAYYPGWTVTVDGKPVSAGPDGYGRLTFEVPQGTHTGRIFLGLTGLQRFSGFVSMLGLSVVVISFILRRTTVS